MLFFFDIFKFHKGCVSDKLRNIVVNFSHNFPPNTPKATVPFHNRFCFSMFYLRSIVPPQST